MPRPIYRFLLCTFLAGSIFPTNLFGQSAQTSVASPTLRVTSRLVFLDVTVLDKKGRPVVTGLNKEDFTITEEKRPQQIFSFEAPATHAAKSVPSMNGDAPLTVLVLDLLNSDFPDSAFLRYSIRKYLTAQPDQLASPTELMVIGNESLQLVQGYTRNKEDLLHALDHVPAAVPYKFMSGSFYWERFGQSMDALQQIALQNEGVPGRKNIVWVGHGGPSLFKNLATEPYYDKLDQYVRETTNMLVDARVSLFVIYPGLKVDPLTVATFPISASSAMVEIGDNDPFAGDINFGVFVNETGGKLFYNRNDVDREIDRSQVLGSNYYTLTYQPQGGTADGKFRRVRVTLRDPNLRVITKAGYYAPDQKAPFTPGQQTLFSLVEAAEGSISFPALNLEITHLVRHRDTHTADFIVMLKPKIIGWEPAGEGRSTANVTLAALSLSKNRDILASKQESVMLTANTQNALRLESTQAIVPVTLRIPRRMQTLRVAVQLPESGRIGTVELDRRAIDAAPDAPTPLPAVRTRPPGQ